ncbi:hypothetical protein EBU91_04335 [bacterium]|nr:hypothetical protein [bacterium]
MKNLKENLHLFILGLVIWICCLVFFPRLWAGITLVLGVIQMTSCSQIPNFSKRVSTEKSEK